MDVNEVKQRALKEIREEDFKEAVSKYKYKLRNKKSFFDFFPYKIVIIKKGEIE